MRFPVACGMGLTCAKDLASDLRAKIQKQMDVACRVHEMSADEKADYDIINEQIKSELTTEIQDGESIYCVGDYVTPMRERKAESLRQFEKSSMARFVEQVFH